MPENAMWKTLWKVWITLRRSFLWKVLCKSLEKMAGMVKILETPVEIQGNLGKPGRTAKVEFFGALLLFPGMRQKPTN